MTNASWPPPGHVTRTVTFTVDTPAEVSDSELAERFAGMWADAPVMTGWWVSPVPEVAAEARWTSLRDQITRDIAIEQDHGDDYSEGGTDLSWDQANPHWGRADAFREVLATMDRLEADR